MTGVKTCALPIWIGRFHFSGWAAWVAWLSVHLVFLLGFRNKIAVLLQWTYSYFAYKRGARLITSLPPEPADANEPRA